MPEWATAYGEIRIGAIQFYSAALVIGLIALGAYPEVRHLARSIGNRFTNLWMWSISRVTGLGLKRAVQVSQVVGGVCHVIAAAAAVLLLLTSYSCDSKGSIEQTYGFEEYLDELKQDGSILR